MLHLLLRVQRALEAFWKLLGRAAKLSISIMDNNVLSLKMVIPSL